MKVLSNEELNNLSGGFSITKNFIIFGGLISFVIGLIDRFTKQIKCN